MEKALLNIAKLWLDVETLDEQNRDCLDFHDIHVNQIKAALEAAYNAGREANKKEGK